MQITVDRKALSDALSAVRAVIEARNTIPILSHIAIKVADTGTLTLEGTDLDMALAMTLAGEFGSTAGGFAVQSTLVDIVRKAASDSVTLAEKLAKSGAESCAVAAGRANFVLGILPLQDFPAFIRPKLGATTFTLSAADLRRLFALTQHAISADETRYYLTGVYLHAGHDPDRTSATGAHLIAVATDGHRLARVSMDLPDSADALSGVIVPRKMAQTCLKLLPDKGDVTITIDDARMLVEWTVPTGAVALSSKLIDGTFPDYGRVIPSHNPHLATIAREALIAATDLVLTVGGERGHAVKCEFGDGAPLKLTVVNQNAGSGCQEIDCEFAGDDVTIGFNGRYLSDVAGTHEGDDLTIALDAPGSPAVFRNDPYDGHLSVLMPMRV